MNKSFAIMGPVTTGHEFDSPEADRWTGYVSVSPESKPLDWLRTRQRGSRFLDRVG
jgi:hypothetical protein